MNRVEELVGIVAQKEYLKQDCTAERNELQMLMSGNAQTQPVQTAVDPQPTVQTAQAPVETATAGGAVTRTQEYNIKVNMDAFRRGGIAFRLPVKNGQEINGAFRSKWTGLDKSSTKDGQLWATFETDDPSLDAQGRGAIVVSPEGEGAFKLKDILNGTETPYTESGKEHIKFKAIYPIYCYADWASDEKASGNVRVDNPRPLGKQVV